MIRRLGSVDDCCSAIIRRRLLVKKINRYLSATAIILLIQGCSVFYYGHTKEEWNNLTEKEKREIKSEYQSLIDSRNEQAHTDTIDARTQSVVDYGVKK
jgi:PBP1b-binding outer membrane lipoprotein LpoB